MNDLLNKLSFQGYIVEVQTASGSTWTWTIQNSKSLKKILGQMGRDPLECPKPEDMALLIANYERVSGLMCRPHRVWNLDRTELLWDNPDNK
jgi:hypothetical protein